MTLTLQETAQQATILRLTRGSRQELDLACAQVRTTLRPLLAVRREDFPLPTLGPQLASAARDLDRASRHLVVRGVPTGSSLQDLRRVLWGIGRHVGIAVPQDAIGHLVRDVGSADPAFHTGGSDVTALLSTEGGEVVSLVDTRDLYDAVVRTTPHLAGLLFAPVPFALPGESGYRLVPLACLLHGSLSLRYDREAIDRARCAPGAPVLSGPHRTLLDTIDALLPGLSYDVQLRAGDLLLINNHEALHRVGAVSSRLLQLWLTLREGRVLPPGYVWSTPTYGEAGGRCGVTPRDVVS